MQDLTPKSLQIAGADPAFMWFTKPPIGICKGW